MWDIKNTEQLSVKDKHKLKIIEALQNPDNEIANRKEIAEKILGISTSGMYKIFTPDELAEIEGEALKRRRARLSLKLGAIDKALVEKATIDKDVKAIELCYKRFEGWNPNQKIEINDGSEPESIEITFSVIDGKKTDTSTD